MDIAMKKRASEISAGWLSSWSGARFTAAVVLLGYLTAVQGEQ